MKIIAVVLSGGSGKRFGSDTPKQYLEINGKPVLAYALQAFEQSIADEVVIVAAKEYLEKCRQISEDWHCSKVSGVIPGGSERYYSVMNALIYLAGKYKDAAVSFDGQRSQDIQNPQSNDSGPEHGIMVLIHDGARPFIRPEVISEIADQVKIHGAAIAATPCTDTIKISDENGMIVSTTHRSLTWAAQTPQGFWLKEIHSAYTRVFAAAKDPITAGCEGVLITDDAMVYQLAFPDRPVKMVNAGSENMKITNASDLDIAKTIGHVQVR